MILKYYFKVQLLLFVSCHEKDTFEHICLWLGGNYELSFLFFAGRLPKCACAIVLQYVSRLLYLGYRTYLFN